MAKRIFVNNTNSYVGQAIFQQLRNDTEENDDPNIIYGTYMEKDSSEKPKGIRKMLKVRSFLTPEKQAKAQIQVHS